MADPKSFSLKQIEQDVIRQQQNAVLSTFLSYIAIERLGYQITPTTRFSLNENMSEVTVTEESPEPAEGEIVTEPKAKK